MYQVDIIEPQSGQLRTLCLYDGITNNEIQLLLKSLFHNINNITCLTNNNNINYPISMLANNPSLFNKQQLFILTPDSNKIGLYNNNYDDASDNSTDNDSDNNNCEVVFKILDKNGDNMIHKEEFIECVTYGINQYINKYNGYQYSYLFLTPTELAIELCKQCYRYNSFIAMKNGELTSFSDNTNEIIDGGLYYLTLEQFSLWYNNTNNNNPLKELMKLSIESLAIITQQSFDEYDVINNNNDNKTLKRSKSLQQLQLRESYLDKRVKSFIKSCQYYLKLTGPAVTYLIDLINVSTKSNNTINRDGYIKLFYIFLIQHDVTPNNNNDKGLVSILDTIYDIVSCDDNININELCCLLSIISPSDYITTLKAVYDVFITHSNNNNNDNVSDNILYIHLTQIIRIILHFSPQLQEHLNPATANDIAYGAALKLLLLVEPNRKHSDVLTFEEYVELFIHSLKLVLECLQIQDGYFVLYLQRLIQETAGGSIGEITSTSSVGSGDSMATLRPVEDDSDDEDEDEENDECGSSGDSTSDPLAKELLACNSIDYDSEGLGAQIMPEESLDNNDEVIRAGVVLEETQVRATSIAYSGKAITINEAKKVLKLSKYNSGKICMWLESIAEFGMVPRAVYRKGMLESICDAGDTSPMKRSILEFIVDRVYDTFDVEGEGVCPVQEIGCAILLFCSEDKLTRSKLALNLIQTYCPDYAGVVQCIAALFKATVCLDPALKHPDEFCIAANIQADDEASSYYPDKDDTPPLLGGDPINHMNFLELFSVMLLMCEKGVLDLGLDTTSSRYSASQADDMDDEDDYDNNSNNNDNNNNNEEEEEEEEDMDMYHNDDVFPPSSVVLELRAARAVLGLEEYSADDLIDSLAERCHAGKLQESGWIGWLSHITHVGQVAEQDLDIAIHLGNQLFSAFDESDDQSGMIDYCDIGAGMAFLCGKSPMEERIMVAFTIIDSDCDGAITQLELVKLIKSALITLSVCSRMAADKILLLGDGINVNKLAEAATKEAVSSLDITSPFEPITLEMLLDLADDFLKLAAIF